MLTLVQRRLVRGIGPQQLDAHRRVPLIHQFTGSDERRFVTEEREHGEVVVLVVAVPGAAVHGAHVVLLPIGCPLPAGQAGGAQCSCAPYAVEDQLACGSDSQVDARERRGQEKRRQRLPGMDQGDDQDDQGQPQGGCEDAFGRTCSGRCDAREEEPEEVAMGP
ncbi:hypothetical protein [Streptomyces sp. NPDC004135]